VEAVQEVEAGRAAVPAQEVVQVQAAAPALALVVVHGLDLEAVAPRVVKSSKEASLK